MQGNKEIPWWPTFCHYQYYTILSSEQQSTTTTFQIMRVQNFKEDKSPLKNGDKTGGRSLKLAEYFLLQKAKQKRTNVLKHSKVFEVESNNTRKGKTIEEFVARVDRIGLSTYQLSPREEGESTRRRGKSIFSCPSFLLNKLTGLMVKTTRKVSR